MKITGYLKFTNGTIEIRCECGKLSEIPFAEALFVRCPVCKKTWSCNPAIYLDSVVNLHLVEDIVKESRVV